MGGSLPFFDQKLLQPWLHPYLSVDRNASRLAGVGREPDFSAVEGAADAEQLGAQRPQQPEPGEDQRHPGEEAAGFPWQPHRTLLATGRLWHRGAAGKYVYRQKDGVFSCGQIGSLHPRSDRAFELVWCSSKALGW